jgi:hypothetical protein
MSNDILYGEHGITFTTINENKIWLPYTSVYCIKDD